MGKMLLVIDAQYDFLDGGNLAVNGSMEKMNKLVEHISNENYDIIVFTADWHPHDHMSFVKKGGMWPAHCVQHTHGAAIYQPLFDIAHEKCELTQILEKGNIRSKEEYSVMDNHLSSLILLRAIGLYQIQQIDVCGIAGDYCVKESIEGLLKHGLKDNICVLKDFCPSIDDGTVLNNFIAENGLKSI